MSSHALSRSVLSHPSREARRVVFRFPRLPHHPPCPPFARGGKGSLARHVIPSCATKTSVSKSSLQVCQHQLLPAQPIADVNSEVIAVARRGGHVVRWNVHCNSIFRV